MGGHAFAASNPPLPTPRMPLETYTRVLGHVHRILRKYYSHVDSAIEAPEKVTYGDIDTLVYGPFDPTWDDLGKSSPKVAETLAQALEAKRFIRQSGNPTINFAIPWPGKSDDGNGREQRYIQLDVHVCFSLVSFKWDLFHFAHGDLWNIIGSTIRPFGLTVNDRGMYLRIPEIEAYDRKKSMVFLTATPEEVMRFLGLDEERWFKQFQSKQEMFEYATGCLMFWVKELSDTNESEGELREPLPSANDNPGTSKHNIGGLEGGEKGKQKLKANDRRRMAQRPIFREWINEFIPRCRAQGTFGDARTTREQVRRDAFEEFGAKEEYETKLKEWKLIKNQDDLSRVVIKGSIPVDDVDPAFRGAAVRTLKAAIIEGVEFDGVAPPASVKDPEGLYDLEVAKRFVLENWERAGRAGLARQELKAVEAMRAKAGKKEREAKEKDQKEMDP